MDVGKEVNHTRRLEIKQPHHVITACMKPTSLQTALFYADSPATAEPHIPAKPKILYDPTSIVCACFNSTVQLHHRIHLCE